jgi:hypothetical protein
LKGSFRGDKVHFEEYYENKIDGGYLEVWIIFFDGELNFGACVLGLIQMNPLISSQSSSESNRRAKKCVFEV